MLTYALLDTHHGVTRCDRATTATRGLTDADRTWVEPQSGVEYVLVRLGSWIGRRIYGRCTRGLSLKYH